MYPVKVFRDGTLHVAERMVAHVTRRSYYKSALSLQASSTDLLYWENGHLISVEPSGGDSDGS